MAPTQPIYAGDPYTMQGYQVQPDVIPYGYNAAVPNNIPANAPTPPNQYGVTYQMMPTDPSMPVQMMPISQNETQE